MMQPSPQQFVEDRLGISRHFGKIVTRVLAETHAVEASHARWHEKRELNVAVFTPAELKAYAWLGRR